MSVMTKSWRFDPALQMVVDDSGAIVCSVTWGLEPAVGQLIAAAPVLAAVAHDLHSHVGDSLSHWQDEEDSVQEEHADLIVDLDAADRRAETALGAGDSAFPANTLRELAQALLARAHQIDKLVPYVVVHSHRQGKTFYTTWSTTSPTEERMKALLQGKYEPERGESLTYSRLAIEDLTGAMRPARSSESEDDEEGDDQGYGPTFM